MLYLWAGGQYSEQVALIHQTTECSVHQTGSPCAPAVSASPQPPRGSDPATPPPPLGPQTAARHREPPEHMLMFTSRIKEFMLTKHCIQILYSHHLAVLYTVLCLSVLQKTISMVEGRVIIAHGCVSSDQHTLVLGLALTLTLSLSLRVRVSVSPYSNA